MTGRPDPDRRFDEELRRAARALVTEELPPGVLDPSVGAALGLGSAADGAIRPRRSMPGFAAIAATVVVLLLATAIAFAPASPGGPGPSPTPSASPPSTTLPSGPLSFRATSAIQLDFETLQYACGAGRPLASIGPDPNAMAREGVVCTAPAAIGPFRAAVIVGESAADEVVQVHAKADFTAGDTPAGRASVASMLAKAAAISVPQGFGTTFGDWVHANVPSLEVNQQTSTTILGVSVTLSRTSDGGYMLQLELSPAT